jgi:uncharacterized protein
MIHRLRTTATGRGLHYTLRRGLREAALRAAYATRWPARLWEMVPGATHVQLVRHRMVLPAGRRPAAPLRIAFASDLHDGPTTPERTIDEAFRLLAAAEPDVLVLGGDYVFLDATPETARALEARVRSVPARVKVAVLGNHDLWTYHGLLEEALARAGATVLVNASVRLGPPHDDVAIIGIDDPWTGRPDGDRAFAGLEEPAAAGAAEGPRTLKIGVCHAPGGFAHLRGRDVALFLCGHTHGGQIALPGELPVVVPGGPYARRWPYGLHEAEGTTVFVSRGVGTSELPIRIQAPPDVVVFDLC